MNTIRPQASHGIVNRITGSNFNYQGWPTVARDENGTLYAVASGFRAEHVCPFGKTVMYISKNNGNTWSSPIIINDTYMDDRDVGILYMGNGRMLITWFNHPAKFYEDLAKDGYFKTYVSPAAQPVVEGQIAGYQQLPDADKVGGSYIRISDDYGFTWGPTIRVPVSAPHGPALCKDGSLLYLGIEMYANGELPKGAAALYISTDGGQSWRKQHLFEEPSWLQPNENLDEPHIIELPDGKLLGAFRIEGRWPFTIATTVSEDVGATWNEMICTNVSGSPPHLMLHSSGALICSYGRREDPVGERAMVSHDYGKTWTEEYILCDGPFADLGYPSTVELDDGSLLTVYYQRYADDTKCFILYTKWKL